MMGPRELKALDSEGSISIHSEAVIKKNDDGTITVKQEGDDFPIHTVGGTAVGALIGLLGRPSRISCRRVSGNLCRSRLGHGPGRSQRRFSQRSIC